MQALDLSIDQLDNLSEVALWELARVAGILDNATTADVTWYDSEGKEWTLTGHALIIGSRALLWTTSDEAGKDDSVVWPIGREHDRNQEVLARDHAEEIASGIGTLEQPVPTCTSPEHDWQPNPSGLADNPGVHGHGGGVLVIHVCTHCGLLRMHDTWASDGRGGRCVRISYVTQDDPLDKTAAEPREQAANG